MVGITNEKPVSIGNNAFTGFIFGCIIFGVDEETHSHLFIEVAFLIYFSLSDYL